MLGITHLLFAAILAFLLVNIFSFSHPILFFLLFCFLAFFLLGWYFHAFWIGLALAGGYIAHLVTDMLTLSGVKPYWIGPRISGFMRTGGFLEAVFFFLLLVFFVWLVVFKNTLI